MNELQQAWKEADGYTIFFVSIFLIFLTFMLGVVGLTVYFETHEPNGISGLVSIAFCSFVVGAVFLGRDSSAKVAFWCGMGMTAFFFIVGGIGAGLIYLIKYGIVV